MSLMDKIADTHSREARLLNELPIEIKNMLRYAFPSDALLCSFLSGLKCTMELDTYGTGAYDGFSNLSILIEMDSACYGASDRIRQASYMRTPYLTISFYYRGIKYRLETRWDLNDILNGSDELGFSLMRMVLFSAFMLGPCQIPINIYDENNLVSVLSCLKSDADNGSDVLLKLYLENTAKFNLDKTTIISCCQNNDMIELVPVIMRCGKDDRVNNEVMRL